MSQFDPIRHRRELHKIPEPGFSEYETQRYLLSQLEEIQTDYMEIVKWKTGAFVLISGYDAVKTLGFRADIDGLPIQEETGHDFSSNHEGYMHACGHDFHMTIALGLAAHCAETQPKDHILLIFQPAEEGPGGAAEMVNADFYIEHRPEFMFSFHVKPDLKIGQIGIRPGTFFANTSELFVDLIGKSGHAATPHLADDMVVAGSHLITQLQTIVSRNIDPLDTAVVTVGKLEAGTRQNIIAETARLSGTIRTFSSETMKQVKERIVSLTKGLEVAFNCKTAIDWGAEYSQVYNDPDAVARFVEFIKSQTELEVVDYPAAMFGEDFGYFLQNTPGFMAWIGVEGKNNLHSGRFDPDERALEIAIDTAIQFLSSL